MTPISELWLPILLAAVAVFFTSSLVHMVLPIHRSDWAKLPDEEKALDALRGLGIAPGVYMFPNACSPKEMGTPEIKAKLERGPVGHLTMLPPGGCTMGKSLFQWFLLSLAISAGAGYVAGIGLAPGAAGMTVFRLTATVALFAYAGSAVTDSIWKGVPWCTAAKFVFDGVLYSLATGAVFAWLWPSAGAALGGG